MASRQEMRSEETKRAILRAAGQLFSQKGFDAVTMREIAKEAACSHTTIYIYFKDKEALLHQLSMEPLQALKREMEAALGNLELSPRERLKSITKRFIEFCFTNRNMFTIFFMERATRVDEEAPVLEINKLRNALFGLLRQGIGVYLERDPGDDFVLACARIYFYTLHGILGTYAGSDEPFDEMMARLTPTFELTADVLLAGFQQHIGRGMNSDEN